MVRSRLLGALLGRWSHRVTVVIGGPGFGKTTLLAQMVAENRLAPRGEDVWIGVDQHDRHAGRLAAAVGHALGTEGPDSGAGPVVAEVWRRAPIEVCLVFDDVHLLGQGSPGPLWLGELVDALPANGHVVVASRSELPSLLTRLAPESEIVRLDESDLRFSETEMADLAARRSVDPARFRATGGWPALAELTSTLKGAVTDRFLWEEVLDQLGAPRRRVLGALCALGGGDDRLASAALEAPVALAESLEGVPLVAADEDGWHVPHALWQDVPGLASRPVEADPIRRRAVADLEERERFDDAFALIQRGDLWDLAPALLRRVCLVSDWATPARLDGWLRASPPAVRASPAGRLASALRKASTTPTDAIEPLRASASESRARGDVDAELTAIAQLARLAWWRQDLAPLGIELASRVFELEATGHPTARALATFGRAIFADISGDDAGVLAHLAVLERGVLDAGWEALADWLAGIVRLDVGDATSALEIVERSARRTSPGQNCVFDAVRLRTWWALGRVGQVLEEIPAVLDAVRASGIATNLYMSLTTSSVVLSHTGHADDARRCLDEAAPIAPTRRNGEPSVRTALAMASLHLAEGNERQAADVLRQALAAHGLNRGVDRRGWRQTLALSYVLVPETRAEWDAAPLHGQLDVARRLAASIVALRAGDREPRGTIELPDPAVIRTALHHRFAAELAVGLTDTGRAEGPALLEALGPPGRDAVRTLGETDARRATAARSLLAAVPPPPPAPLHIAVLGPLILRRGDDPDAPLHDTVLRRNRPRALLAFLIGHRSTDRSAIAAALWPELDQRSAANNLAVTLSYLVRALEPSRPTATPTYLLRIGGQALTLITGDHLRLDIDDFDAHVNAAARAEADGATSLALDHNLAATRLYRGDLHADLPDADWFAIDREHYRRQFVTAAVRAGQLLVGRRDTGQAEALARRALAVDPWAELAHTVLIAAALTNGNASAAHHRMERCLKMLAELGLPPSDTTIQLHRRITTGSP